MGEKKIIERHPELLQALQQTTHHYTAGSPTDEEVKYTHLSPLQLAMKLAQKGFGQLSAYLIKQLLKVLGFKKRKMHKNYCPKQVPLRNEQFEHIATLKAAFLDKGLPVLSIDTKKKELLGPFFRNGQPFSTAALSVLDHDFPSYADGKVIPHGIYDIGRNFGYLTLGTSHDTSAFVCDNLEYFWTKELQWIYPQADTILLLCDGGGSNNCRHYRFKQDIYLLAQRLGINIVVAHYPTYCSKWNPIEHRLFCHISRQWRGVVFENIQIVKELAELTSTKTGLEVKVRINHFQYQTGRKTDEGFKQRIEQFITFSDHIPKWNYMASFAES